MIFFSFLAVRQNPDALRPLSGLEKAFDKLGEDDLKGILENSSASEAERFNELQCAMIANRVDAEDRRKKESGKRLKRKKGIMKNKSRGLRQEF